MLLSLLLPYLKGQLEISVEIGTALAGLASDGILDKIEQNKGPPTTKA